MNIFRPLVLAVLLLFSVVLIADEDSERARALLLQGDIISLDSLLTEIRKQGDWTILEIELEQEDEHFVYEVELLDQHGRVHKRHYDAKTGQPIKQDD